MILGIGIGLIIGFVGLLICLYLVVGRRKDETPSWVESQTKTLEAFWAKNNELRALEILRLEEISISLKTIASSLITD